MSKYLDIVNKEGELESNPLIQLNEEKIKQAAVWDGLKGLIINKENHLSHEEILTQYNNLWQVEESFRITKHDLKIRPVYHFKPRRVKAHLAISFMAYTLVRHLEHRVRLRFKKLSPKVIRNTLLSVETSILYCNKNKIRYGFPSSISSYAKKIYSLMEVKRFSKAFIIKKH